MGGLKDHSTGEYGLAHCLVTSSYDKGNWGDPLYPAPSFKESVGPQEGGEFQSKVTLAKEIAGKIIKEEVAGVFAFDAWYLCQELVGFLEEKERLWVSRMKKNRKVKYRGRWQQGQELARALPAEAYARVEVGGKVSWGWSGMMEISELEGKKRVVIFWEGEVGQGEPVFLATNAYGWHRERGVSFSQGRWGGRDAAPRWEAALGTGGLSEAQNRRSQAAWVSGDEGIQSAGVGGGFAAGWGERPTAPDGGDDGASGDGASGATVCQHSNSTRAGRGRSGEPVAAATDCLLPTLRCALHCPQTRCCLKTQKFSYYNTEWRGLKSLQCPLRYATIVTASGEGSELLTLLRCEYGEMPILRSSRKQGAGLTRRRRGSSHSSPPGV